MRTGQIGPDTTPDSPHLDALIEHLVEAHEKRVQDHHRRLWAYYRNEVRPAGAACGSRAARTAQAAGLPARLTARSPHADDRSSAREIVIENDIAWRIQTMVDFMFGKPVQILSTARDPSARRTIEAILDAVWEASGGIALLQDMALLGHVYGHVDLLLRVDDAIFDLDPSSSTFTPDQPERFADKLAIEVVEPTRGIPILDPADYRKLLGYIVRFERPGACPVRSARPARFRKPAPEPDQTTIITELFTPDLRRLTIDDRLIEEHPNRALAGLVPVAHIQNMSQPLRYEGIGEVEGLIPLQDELNTRLSDRASRVTMQSFKMYLAKGIEGFDRAGVGPGALWQTDNPEASIEAFGGDAASPSEQAHIDEIREAMDKVSGVPPLAAGVVRAKIGNLSSANALRVTLLGLLGKTARKRVTYGRGIAQMCRMILTALNIAGILETDDHDRGVRLVWPDPLPTDLREQALAARTKSELGVPRERVLAELGHAPSDPGVV